jgi:hypothetical protein
MGINYVADIIKEADASKRIANLDRLIAERMPAELLVLTAISVLSDDPRVRRTALERVDSRNTSEGNAAARVISLLQSWSREGQLMTYPHSMDDAQKTRAAEIEAAHAHRRPLASVVR